MKLIVSDEIIQSYPDLRIGCVVAREINNVGTHDEIENLKREKALSFCKQHTPETLADHPHIVAWQEAYKSFGVKPKKYPPTVEATAKRVLKKGEFPTISKVVDLYLVAEIQNLIPVGGYDLDRVEGDIVLKKSPGNEKFIPIGGTAEELTFPGEVVYTDTSKILTKSWNYKDCDFCKITELSRNIALFAEAPSSAMSDTSLREIVSTIQEYLTKYCGGKVSGFIANVRDSNTWELQ